MSRVNAHVARRFLEQAIQALDGDEDALSEAMRGPLGRSVQLHREVAGSLEDPVDTSESSLTLLEWWLESIGAMEPEEEHSWVEPPDEDAALRIPDPASATPQRLARLKRALPPAPRLHALVPLTPSA